MKSRTTLLIALALLVGLVFTNCVPPEPLPQPAVQSQSSDAAAPQNTQVAVPEPQDPIDPVAPEDDAAAEAAREFFEAYLERSNPMWSGSDAYEEQKYLSEAYQRQLAEIKAGFEGIGFDPVLQVQNPPPGPVEVKEARVAGNEATVVLQFGRGVLDQPWERIVSLERIDGAWLIVPDRLEEAARTPEETVEAFYAWYLSYIGSGEQMRNPLVDQAYRAAPFLDPQYINRVDRMGESGFGYDPFLCAQDVPESMRVTSSFDNASHPTVVVESSFAGHFLTVDLIRTNFNLWSIRNINCGASPAGTAKAFYTWALGYMTKNGELHNPWVEDAYHDSPYLSQAFIQKLDERIASDEPLNADPVLLAQDLPQAFNVSPCAEEGCALVNLQFGDAAIRQLRVETEADAGARRITAIRHEQEFESSMPSEPLPGVEHWVPFKDEQYGFTLRYPAEWKVTGLKVTEMSDAAQRPILRSVYFEEPQSLDRLYPISIDVYYATESQFTETHASDERLDQRTINGYPVSIYRYEPGVVYYAFQHPSRENTWIIITDMVTQFRGREDVAKRIEGVFDRMISTISFAE